MNRARHLVLAFGLALALVLGQHATALHGLAHVTGERGQDESAPAGGCEEHSLFLALGQGVEAQAVVAPLVVAQAGSPAVEVLRSAALAPRLPFRSRAPPPPLA
jgi:hypothetical protein